MDQYRLALDRIVVSLMDEVDYAENQDLISEEYYKMSLVTVNTHAP
jgi:hypothetical protein